MSTASRRTTKTLPLERPLLENGDRMTQAEFHRRYETYPDDVKIELIEGVVYMASPLRRAHGKYHLELATLFRLYQEKTFGVEALDNVTTILGEESEPQPDLALRIVAAYGRSRETADDYIQGPPELIAEVAHSTRSIDMHQKRRDYERAGVLEYSVLCIEEPAIHWFQFQTGTELHADRRGVFHSSAFPGLWIDGEGVLALDHTRAARVLRKGLASPEHGAFVRRLHRRGHA